jgi:hypothetical protein
MTPTTQKSTIIIGGVSLDVDYTHHPEYRGAYERGGIQVSPGEPAHNEVEDVRVSGTNVSIFGLIEELDAFDTIEAKLSLETDEGY